MLINDPNSLNLTPFTSHQHISGGIFLQAIFLLSHSLSYLHSYVPSANILSSSIFGRIYSLFYRMRFIRYGSHQNGWTKRMIYKHIANVEVSAQLCWFFFQFVCAYRFIVMDLYHHLFAMNYECALITETAEI